MSRARCMAAGVSLAAAVALAACGNTTTTPITELNLDRPVDVAFGCYGSMRMTGGNANPSGMEPIVQTAQPTFACQALSPPLSDPTVPAAVPAPGQQTLNGITPTPAWYAFILQSGPGTIALATWLAQPSDKMVGGVSDAGGDFQVLDADPLTPGKNAISIGEEPIAIATDTSGCYEITANAGSCDLSELNINSALDDIAGAGGGLGGQATQVIVNRIPVTAPGGPILSKPAAMVIEPGQTVVGNSCPTTPQGRVWIAYPGCHMVAGVNSTDGKIFAAITFDPTTGAPSVITDAALSTLACPAECTGTSGATTALSNGVRPTTLDFRNDTRVNTLRLAIGAENNHSVTMVDLDPATFAPVPASVFQVPLEDPRSTLGVTALALSPQIGMGGNAQLTNAAVSDEGTPGGQGQYVYAVTNDGTVRVADVLTLKRECDTQSDGRYIREAGLDIPHLQCIGPDDKIPRRSGARGPGIELPDDAFPTSVAIVKARVAPPPVLDASNNITSFETPAPSVWLGYFAAISSANGTVYVANVDDDYAPDAFTSANPLATQPVLVMPHQLRDNFTTRDQGDVDISGNQLCTALDPLNGGKAGGPRVSAPPAQAPPTNTLTTDRNGELPKFHQYQCMGSDATPTNPMPVSELEFGSSRQIRDGVYPDLKSVLSETWTLTYEGTLSLDNQITSVDGPMIRESQIQVDGTGMHLVDNSTPFCGMGVEPFDIVDLRGCDPSHGDGDCPADYTCFVHPKSNVSIGACMLKSEAPRLSAACFDFLTTQRRYTVGQTNPGELVLLERKHELAMTPVDGCTGDDQCNTLAQAAFAINPSADPFIASPVTGQHATTWSCQADPLRAPVNTDPNLNKRCVQTCSLDPTHPADCATGSLCRLNDGSTTEGVCMEGVEPPQACVNGPQRFDVRGSEAFVMIGQRSGYVHPIIAQGGACVRDPSASPIQIGRFPLKAPACDPTSDPITGALPGGGFEANPCSLTVSQFEYGRTYVAGTEAGAPPPIGDTCVLNSSTNPQFRMAPALKVRNRAMTMTIVDPTWPGDTVAANQTCVQDRGGSLGNVPWVVTGYQLEFEQKAGYEPYTLGLFGSVSPNKVVRGPTESIWVVDDGDFVATSITQASTRGRVFRIESTTNVVNTLQ